MSRSSNVKELIEIRFDCVDLERFLVLSFGLMSGNIFVEAFCKGLIYR